MSYLGSTIVEGEESEVDIDIPRSNHNNGVEDSDDDGPSVGQVVVGGSASNAIRALSNQQSAPGVGSGSSSVFQRSLLFPPPNLVIAHNNAAQTPTHAPVPITDEGGIPAPMDSGGQSNIPMPSLDLTLNSGALQIHPSITIPDTATNAANAQKDASTPASMFTLLGVLNNYRMRVRCTTLDNLFSRINIDKRSWGLLIRSSLPMNEIASPMEQLVDTVTEFVKRLHRKSSHKVQTILENVMYTEEVNFAYRVYSRSSLLFQQIFRYLSVAQLKMAEDYIENERGALPMLQLKKIYPRIHDMLDDIFEKMEANMALEAMVAAQAAEKAAAGLNSSNNAQGANNNNGTNGTSTKDGSKSNSKRTSKTNMSFLGIASTRSRGPSRRGSLKKKKNSQLTVTTNTTAASGAGAGGNTSGGSGHGSNATSTSVSRPESAMTSPIHTSPHAIPHKLKGSPTGSLQSSPMSFGQSLSIPPPLLALPQQAAPGGSSPSGGDVKILLQPFGSTSSGDNSATGSQRPSVSAAPLSPGLSSPMSPLLASPTTTAGNSETSVAAIAAQRLTLATETNSLAAPLSLTDKKTNDGGNTTPGGAGGGPGAIAEEDEGDDSEEEAEGLFGEGGGGSGPLNARRKNSNASANTASDIFSKLLHAAQTHCYPLPPKLRKKKKHPHLAKPTGELANAEAHLTPHQQQQQEEEEEEEGPPLPHEEFLSSYIVHHSRSFAYFEQLLDTYLCCLMSQFVALAISETLQKQDFYSGLFTQINNLASHFVRVFLPFAQRLLAVDPQFLAENIFALSYVDIEVGMHYSDARQIIRKMRLLHQMFAAVDIFLFPRMIEAHRQGTKSISFSHMDASYAATGGYDQAVRIWDLARNKCLAQFIGHKSIVTWVSFTSNDSQIISGSFDGDLKLWNSKTGECVRTFQGHTDGILCGDISHKDKYILSGGMDCMVRLWSLSNGKCMRIYTGHRHWVKSCKFTPDTQTVISAGLDKKIFIWNLRSGLGQSGPKHILTAHTNFVLDLCVLSPERFVSSSKDQSIKMWEIATGKLEAELPNPSKSTAISFALSPCGKYVAAAFFDHTLNVYDAVNAPNFTLLRQLKVHNDGMLVVKWMNSSTLVLGTATGNVQVLHI